jgi:hypothetical protein
VNNDKTSVADLLGPWIETNWESVLILRCKAAWNKPLRELTNLELATFLDQDIATERVLSLARIRVESSFEDDSEFYEGKLSEAVERVVRRG